MVMRESMSWASAKKVHNEAEFNALMETIDAELAQEGVPIPARHFKAVSALRRHLGIEGDIGLSRLPDEPRANSYDADDLIVRAFKWIDERHKGKLAIPLPGQSFVIIRNEPYRVKISNMMGRILFTCDPNSMGIKRP